jgi:hypothetical protein
VKIRLPAEAYDNEPPPILGTWSRIYTVVLLWLVFVIGVCYAFTRYFK